MANKKVVVTGTKTPPKEKSPSIFAPESKPISVYQKVPNSFKK
jgi:hypothetical protein